MFNLLLYLSVMQMHLLYFSCYCFILNNMFLYVNVVTKLCAIIEIFIAVSFNVYVVSMGHVIHKNSLHG